MNSFTRLFLRSAVVLASGAALLCHGADAPVANDWRIAGPFGGTATTVAVDPQNPRLVLAGARDSLLFASEDGGANWNAIDLPRHNLGEITAILVDPANSNHFLVGVLDAIGGGLYESSDGGKSWMANASLRGIGVRALAASQSNPSEFVAGTLQGVQMSSDSGSTWARISDPGNLEMRGITAVAIDPKDPNLIYAGTPHLPWRTKDGGKNWESIHTGMIDDSDVFSIYIDPQASSDVFASACSGIYESVSGGDSWKKIAGIPNTSRRTHVIREDPAHAGTIFAGTTMGLFRSPNKGVSWKVLTSTQVNSLAFDPSQPNTLYLALEYAGVGKSSDAGDAIQLVNNGFVDRQISSVTKAGNKLVAIETQEGETTGLFESSDNGESWSELHGVRGLAGVHLRSVAAGAASPKTILAASPHGLWKTLDEGAIWSPVVIKEAVRVTLPAARPTAKRTRTGKAAPIAPARTRTVLHTVPNADIDGLWAFPDGKKDMLALAIGDAFFLSDDLGVQWRRMDLGSADPVQQFAASPAGDGRLAVKTSHAMLTSSDHGLHWTKSDFPLQMSDVNGIALGYDAGDPILAATRVGLFSSPDGGAQWISTARGLQASTLSAVTYVGQSKTAYVVQYGQLFRSDDAGASWPAVPTALHSLPVRQLWSADSSSNRVYAITSGLGILFRD